ncbi:hypothetical protein RDI58_023636 [Solanum bulbocastanum]|uniref:Uncharacterized protein n=1 Tax=Solanum bulbocastanum TaxID=147425 RepID=A0AAN8Y2J2_SOLBU
MSQNIIRDNQKDEQIIMRNHFQDLEALIMWTRKAIQV